MPAGPYPSFRSSEISRSWGPFSGARTFRQGDGVDRDHHPQLKKPFGKGEMPDLKEFTTISPGEEEKVR